MPDTNLSMVIKLIVDSGKSLRNLSDIKSVVTGLATAFAGLNLAESFVEANKQVENLLRGLNAISKGQGTELFNQLINSANKLGIPIQQVSTSFLELQASTAETNFEGQKTKELFDALANSLTVTGADAVTFNRGFRAMAQILSKDQLYAEELRQQLGEALPGAVQLFARALEISPKQLLQFMQAGVIEGDNLRRTLVLVTREMEKTYQIANEQDFTFTQKAALAQNALNLLFVELGNTGIWRAFGNALLFARDQFVALREAIPSLSDSFKNEFNLIAAIVSGGSEEINNSFQSIDPTFNFETLKKQLAEIASFINDSALGWLRSIVQFTEDAALIIKNFNAKLESQRQPLLTIGIEDEKLFAFLDKINQYTPSVKLKELFAAYLEDIKEISSTPVEIVPEIVPDDFNKFKKDVIEFNRNAEIDFTISDENLVKIYNEYIERINRANEAIREQNALNEQTNRILKKNTIESENAAKSRKTAEQVARENADAMEAFRKAQKDANALQKIYDIDLNYESTLKERSLKISKEQAKLDKEILGIQQTYQDAMLDINASKYQRWAEQGKITREAAQLFTEAANAEAAYKAWVAAQDAVAAYNKEAAKGEKANKETLDALKQQADDQLRYAAGKAKEIGDEYRIKQIMEEQIALRNRQKQLIQDFGQILNRAEINTKANPVPEPEKKAVVNDLQSYLDQNKPIASIVPQIDEGSQQQAIESIRTVKDELDFLKQSAIIPVVLNLQDNTQGLIRSAGLTNIPDQNIRITVDDNGKLRQAMLDAKQLQEAIQNLQSGKKFTVEFLDPQGNVERIAEYAKEGKTVKIKTDLQQIQSEGTKAGQTIAQSAQQAVDQKPIQTDIVVPNISQLRDITSKLSNDLFSELPSAKFNAGIQAAMGQAVTTVKTGVAQMNQELVKGLADKGIKISIDPVTQSDVDGWKRNVQRLTATGPGLEFPIKGFQVPNGTWSDIVAAGNRYLETNRLLLSPTINPDNKIQLLNEIETIKPAIPATIDIDQSLRDADRAAQQNPIEVSADAQPLIGDIQAQLEALRKSGATKIKVDFDEKSKKLLITADITQAQGDIAALKTQIETSPAVQKVNFTFDPVPTTVDPASQYVNREYDDPITRLPDAVQYVQRIYTGGSPSGMARGGLVPGGYSNRDSVSALLAPGEFVIPSSVVRALSPSFFYDLIRSRSLKVPKVSARDNLSVPHFAAGGLVQSSSQPIVINVGSKAIQLSGSREAANQLAKLLTQTGRAL